MARQLTSLRPPLLLKMRSARHFIVWIACYGISTLGGQLSLIAGCLEEPQLMKSILEHLSFYGMVSSLEPHSFFTLTYQSLSPLYRPP